MLMVPTELRPSPIHGIGAFLTAPVKKGALVWRFDSRIDRIFTESEVEALPEVARQFVTFHAVFSEQNRLWMLDGDNGRHFNHAEAPSTFFLNRSFFDDIIAARDLAAGDELTSDYRTICDTWTKKGFVKGHKA